MKQNEIYSKGFFSISWKNMKKHNSPLEVFLKNLTETLKRKKLHFNGNTLNKIKEKQLTSDFCLSLTEQNILMYYIIE